MAGIAKVGCAVVRAESSLMMVMMIDGDVC